MRKRALAALLCALTVLNACGCAMAAAQQSRLTICVANFFIFFPFFFV